MVVSAERDAVIAKALENEVYEYLGAWRERDSLCIFIDKPEGVTADDCQAVSHLLSPLLLAEGVLSERMGLEVSSPGLNRPLFTLSHYQAHIGEEVQVRLQSSLDGRKRFKGILQSVEADTIELLVDNQEFKIDFRIIDRAHICYRGPFEGLH